MFYSCGEGGGHGYRKESSKGGGGSFEMLIFKRVIFALISALTIYIANVYNLPPKRGSSDPLNPTPLPTPLGGRGARSFRTTISPF